MFALFFFLLALGMFFVGTAMHFEGAILIFAYVISIPIAAYIAARYIEQLCEMSPHPLSLGVTVFATYCVLTLESPGVFESIVLGAHLSGVPALVTLIRIASTALAVSAIISAAIMIAAFISEFGVALILRNKKLPFQFLAVRQALYFILISSSIQLCMGYLEYGMRAGIFFTHN